jgi:hypothetical protein
MMVFSRFPQTRAALSLCLLAAVAGCSGSEPEGPTVDHAKLSAELEQRAAAIEAAADEAVSTVEQETASDLAEIKAEQSATEASDELETEAAP